MHRRQLKPDCQLSSHVTETELVHRGGKLAPTTMWWRVPVSFPSRSTPESGSLSSAAGADRLLCAQRSWFRGRASRSLRKLNRRHVALEAFKSLHLLTLCLASSIACGDAHSLAKDELRVAEVGRSYPFHQVERTPWDVPKLFKAPGYDTEWDHLDEEVSEDQVQSEPPEQRVEEPPTALCGNAVLEEGEACDLGHENGLWDEGRPLEALCTLTCQDPVWRGDLYLEAVSHRRLESLWVIDGDVHLDSHLPWGFLWRSVREIRGDLIFHYDSPVIHLDFPLLHQLHGSLSIDANTAPNLESIQAPRLRRIGGDVHFRGHEHLEALELDSLTHIGGGAVVTESASLEVLSLPVLQRVEGNFQVTENPLLCEPWEMFEDWQWVSVFGNMELVRSNGCPFVVTR